MFSELTERLADEVQTIKAALATHEAIRGFLFAADDTSSEAATRARLKGLLPDVPPLLAWRIYDHCAAFTRLYAVYERFVFDLISRWIQLLPDLYKNYADLPDAVRVGHRLGIAEILPKLNGDRYGHLSEQAVVRALYECLAGGPYKLLADAFFTDDTNLRHEALGRLCARIGLVEAWRWLTNHASVQRFLDEVRGNASTAESELKTFVSYRNVAAHGTVEEVVAPEEIRHISDFVFILCASLAELMMRHTVARKLELGEAEPIGVVIHRFRDRVVGVEMRKTRIEVGDNLLLLKETFCYPAVIESLEIEHIRHDVIDADTGLRVGMQLSRGTSVDAELVRILASKPVPMAPSDAPADVVLPNITPA